MDGKFLPIQELINEMPGRPWVNLASANEHVPNIERWIRAEKESIRSIQHILTLNNIPKLFLIHLMFQAIKMLNHFPVKGGIYDTIISTTIMKVESFHYKKNIGLQIGQYCQVHNYDTPCNSNKLRTKGAIYMRPSGNIRGGFKFIRLRSIENITRWSLDIIPMPDTVIYRVKILGKYQPGILVFTDRMGRIIGDGDAETKGLDGDENEAPLIKVDKKKIILTIKGIKRKSILNRRNKLSNNQ